MQFVVTFIVIIPEIGILPCTQSTVGSNIDNCRVGREATNHGAGKSNLS